MTIVFTGSGTGGHFYPNIAIAEAIREIAAARQLLSPRLFYIAPMPFDEQALLANGIVFVRNPAGKVRRYMSARNMLDIFVTIAGYFWSLVTLFRIYPDVVVSKGGYASVPPVLAARTLGIPVIIHESDARPGRANLLASHFAARIAVSFDDTAQYFPPKVRSRIARTGIPLRREISKLIPDTARAYLGLDASVPTIFILGGSSGSQRINETVISSLSDLISFANVIHQTGKANIEGVERTARAVLDKNPHAARYHPVAYLSAEAMREAAAAADIIVSRAGATAIAEISLWKKPSILIPIPEDVSHDQRTNAYAYAKTGAAIVLEEANMTPHLLTSELRRILSDPALAKSMGEKGASFSPQDASTLIAEEVLRIALSHEEPEEQPAPEPTV
ncbi:MAG TPA: UDP-N-acetylglucosamine--N-acetylmuramyl-(pentapeptide) pyrophosphoryl-undecaprenol N-acetylglucosamine transferase [Candidatus Paceibacterota bacterium]